MDKVDVICCFLRAFIFQTCLRYNAKINEVQRQMRSLTMWIGFVMCVGMMCASEQNCGYDWNVLTHFSHCIIVRWDVPPTEKNAFFLQKWWHIQDINFCISINWLRQMTLHLFVSCIVFRDAEASEHFQITIINPKIVTQSLFRDILLLHVKLHCLLMFLCQPKTTNRNILLNDLVLFFRCLEILRF